MNFLTPTRTLIAFVLLLLLSVPLTLLMLQNEQNYKSRAEKSSTLTFLPDTSTNPLLKNPGDTIDLDMMITPGTNQVTFVKFQLTYDPTKITLAADPFTINTAAFPIKVEGPLIATAAGTITHSVSIGSDSTKVIKTATKVGTLHLKAVAGTGSTPTVVSFNNETLVLSSAPTDQAAENILSSTKPAKILISGDAPTGPAGTTILTFSLLLHGVGNAGDNPNPAGNSLSNKNPLHPQRDLEFHVYNNTNELIATKSGALLYDKSSGAFKGKVDLGPTIPSGNYIVKVRTDRYLRKLVPGIQKITHLQENAIPEVGLVAGDTNTDNILNVLDYNAYLDCGYGALNPLPMADQNAPFNSSACRIHTPVDNVDVDDNGIINSADYNLFLRELSVQSGD